MSLRYGLPRHEFDQYTEDQLRHEAELRHLSTDGTPDELRQRLVEQSYPVYTLPTYQDFAPRGVVTYGLLDKTGEPYTQGASRADLIEDLLSVGVPDRRTATQMINQQVQNLVKFYGYTVVGDDDRIVMARRHVTVTTAEGDDA